MATAAEARAPSRRLRAASSAALLAGLAVVAVAVPMTQVRVC